MGRVEDLARVYSDHRYWLLRYGCIAPFVLVALVGYMILFSDPSFSVQTFYVPALNKFINQSTPPDADTLIFFDLELQNAMNYKGLRYGPVKLTFSYAAANTSTAIGTYTVPGFYQGIGKKTRRRGVAVAIGSVRWREAAMSTLSSGSTANFGVDLVTKVRFYDYLFYLWEKRVVARGIVKVDDAGRKVGEKPVELANWDATFNWLVALCTFIGLLAACGCIIYYFPVWFPRLVSCVGF